jgi:hypothetical protein
MSRHLNPRTSCWESDCRSPSLEQWLYFKSVWRVRFLSAQFHHSFQHTEMRIPLSTPSRPKFVALILSRLFCLRLFHDAVCGFDEWWMGKNLEGSGCRLIQAVSQHFLRVTEVKHENLRQERCASAEIWTEYLPNTSLELYRYVNLPDAMATAPEPHGFIAF